MRCRKKSRPMYIHSGGWLDHTHPGMRMCVGCTLKQTGDPACLCIYIDLPVGRI